MIAAHTHFSLTNFELNNGRLIGWLAGRIVNAYTFGFIVTLNFYLEIDWKKKIGSSHKAAEIHMRHWDA